MFDLAVGRAFIELLEGLLDFMGEVGQQLHQLVDDLMDFD